MDNRFSFVSSDKHPKRLFLRTKIAKQLPHLYCMSAYCSEFTIRVNVALKDFKKLGEMVIDLLIYCVFKLNYWSVLLSENQEQIEAVIFYI